MVPMVLLRNIHKDVVQENSSLNVEGKVPGAKRMVQRMKLKEFISFLFLDYEISHLPCSGFQEEWASGSLALRTCLKEQGLLNVCVLETVWDGARGSLGTYKLFIFTRACLRESGKHQQQNL